jgi:acetyltransferase-like isoleucine patch superfamily enzyme
MNTLREAYLTPWKARNHLHRLLATPRARLLFALNGLPWGQGWQLFGLPILQIHRQAKVQIGGHLSLRSTPHSNPLAPAHPVVISVRRAGASLRIGNHFGMTGGVIVVEEQIEIGDWVYVGANCSIVDTDFHALDYATRIGPNDAGKTKPVVIEEGVFIGMNSLILKGAHIGARSVIGAGSVVAGHIPSGVIAAGNPAKVIRALA